MSLGEAAAALGLPEALVERSAAARAAETGVSVDEILAAWAGGETPAQGAAAPASESEPEEAPPVPEPTPEPVAPAAVAPAPAAAMSTAPGPAATRAPIPDEVTPAQAAHLPEVITVPTAGIRERTNFVIPRWLSAVMLAAPLFALFVLGGSATGACGEGTELAVDVISGAIVNCDGSEFTGGGVGGGGTDFVALGGNIYSGSVSAAANCAGCHGAGGQGSDTVPALTGVLTTFGACADHIEWVRLGSQGFTEKGTYGDTNKPVGGGMPAHASLTDEQLASVVSFERVRFGGADTEAVLTDCGLVEADTAGGEGATEGEGGEPTATTIPSG